MTQYLSPNVYVEEIDTGSKPIEGVSTSTAGMLGVTERGPANVPILVTSYGEFTRWFGGVLDPATFVNPSDARDLHCFLPHAVDGFFTNGGKLLYVARVEADGAARAEFVLNDRGTASSAATALLRPAAELSGATAASAVYVLDTNSPGVGALAVGNHVRIGRGSESEYRDVASIGTANHVALHFPLSRSHALSGGATVNEIARVVVALTQPTLAVAVAAGASSIDVNVATLGDIGVGHLLEIGNDPHSAEYRFVTAVVPVSSVAPFVLRLTLDSALFLSHDPAGLPPPGLKVTRLDPAPGGADEIANTTLDLDAGSGDRVVYLTAPGGDFTSRDHLVVFDRGVPAPPNGIAPREARRIGDLSLLRLSFGAYDDYEVASRIAHVGEVPLGPPRQLSASAAQGANVLSLDNRGDLVENFGMLLRVGAAAPFEYLPVEGVPNRAPGFMPPDPGQVQLGYALKQAYPAGTPVLVLRTPVVNEDRPVNVSALATLRGDGTLIATDGGVGPSAYALNDLVRLTTPTGANYFHQLASGPKVANARPVTLTLPLSRPHATGSPVAERSALLVVQALDTGAWGNRLRVSVTDDQPGLVSRTRIVTAIAGNRIRLESASGVEAGTILEILDADRALFATVKVMTVERSTGEITLDPVVALSPGQVATISAVPRSFSVRSREFTLTVLLLAAPDPSVPSGRETVVDREVFRNLSLDPRHSRYVQTIIGDSAGAPRLSDRRPDGESWYVRVHDPAQDLPDGLPALPPYRLDTLNSIRLGPEVLTDLLSDGRQSPAHHPLESGDDSLSTLDDATYVGVDDVDPDRRTGSFALRNVDDVSIVACPGRTSVLVQNALIAQCEELRFRFAVLDAQAPPHDSIADVVNQRQQYDTKYAALYHPWLSIEPPFAVSASAAPEYPIPPSGHVVGVFARTDIERGVHKAPANEVVRGILGLQRTLNQEQQDVLNPYPTNVNVIRDFRKDSRGIRVYGGRCITSDSDWKYVNVRRLMLFIEKSINQGLQWVVFEPNDEELWARVRRSITNFLTLVWRNGALEGKKVEQAFFVKCDRTTMTQTDIDSGRLICVIGVAPVKPAEFVIVRIGLWTANADD